MLYFIEIDIVVNNLRVRGLLTRDGDLAIKCDASKPMNYRWKAEEFTRAFTEVLPSQYKIIRATITIAVD